MSWKIEDCIFFQLAKASQAGLRFWSNKATEHKVTAVQALILNSLYDCDQITSKDLGKRTTLDSATLTGVLDRLEKGGFIKRRQHPDDRRAIRVCLTEKGKETGRSLHEVAITANKDFLKALTDKEQDTLRALLRKVREGAQI